MMSLKIIGSIIIIISTSCIGYIINMRTKNQISELENFKLCMHIFENDIRYNEYDIINCVTKICDSATYHNKKIFKNFLKESYLSEGQPLSEIWKKNITDTATHINFEKSTLNSIIEFGEILGNGDAQSQLKNIELFIKKLDCNIESSKQKLIDSEKVFLKLGVYSGLLIVVFLF